MQSEAPSLTGDEKIRLYARVEKVQAELEIINDNILNLFTQTDAEAGAIQAEYDRCVEYAETIAECTRLLKPSGPTYSPHGETMHASLKLRHVQLPVQFREHLLGINQVL